MKTYLFKTVVERKDGEHIIKSWKEECANNSSPRSEKSILNEIIKDSKNNDFIIIGETEVVAIPANDVKNIYVYKMEVKDEN